jgi:protein-S-isoprenylcysteine O-methyltransferase Ste14
VIKFIQKYRLKLTFILVLLILIYATPKNKDVFFLGVSIIMFGEMVRLWASGYLVKLDEVTTSGPYSIVRNPLYAGTFLMAIGLCLLSESIICYSFFFMLLLFVYLPTIIAEERELEEKFGDEYGNYKKSVSRFIPQLFKRKYEYGGNFNKELFKKNKEYKFLLGWFVILTILYMRIGVL